MNELFKVEEIVEKVEEETQEIIGFLFAIGLVRFESVGCHI